MKFSGTWILATMLCLSSGTAKAQLQLVPDQQLPVMFGGGARMIELSWRNTGSETANAEIRARLLQASSSTAVPIGETPWKNLVVLPGQTVLESARLDFPAVKAETKFIVQWLANSNHVLGTTEVWVYPTNLLAELKPLLRDEILGVLDPNHELKPLLKQAGVEFLDLGETALEDFRGRLAIIGPFQSKGQIREGLSRAIRQIAGKGVAVVWFQPPPGPRSLLQPAFYPVPIGTKIVVVAQASLAAHLAENPQSQINLLHLCRLALNPEPNRLPESNTQP